MKDSDAETYRAAARAFDAVRARRPLVLCLTNAVAAPFTADALAAIGASPAMIADPGEAATLAAAADATLVNLGTVCAEQAAAMRGAVAACAATGRPWTLDPVAIGPLAFRTALCRELLAHKPRLIRGNASEIAELAGSAGGGRGTDAGTAADPAWARRVADETGAAVLMTGATDYIASPAAGRGILSVANGHPLLPQTVGTGCAQGALAAAFCAVTEDPVAAALAAALAMALAGEIAGARVATPGRFRPALLDALYALRGSDFTKGVSVT